MIDIIKMKAYKGNSATPVEIPADLLPAAEEARAKLVEAAAEGEDALMEKYFSTMTLTDEELLRGLARVCNPATSLPVFCASRPSGDRRRPAS